MIEAFEALRSVFRDFSTQGISMVLVCAGILYFAAGKGQTGAGVRGLKGYELLFFLLLANPFGYHIIKDFWMEDYGKLFMVLMPVVLLAAVMTAMMTLQKHILKSGLLAVCFFAVVAAASFFDWDSSQFKLIENEYKVDAEITALDDLIWETEIVPVNMIAPREVCAQIREVNSEVSLMYGESLIAGMLDGTAVSEDEDEQKFIEICKVIIAVPDAVDYQIYVADIYESNCIVLKTDYDDEVLMKKSGFQCYGRTQGYALYFRK